MKKLLQSMLLMGLVVGASREMVAMHEYHQNDEKESKMTYISQQSEKDLRLFTAVSNGNYGDAEDLLKAGANPNARNWLGWTSLHCAIDDYQRENGNIIKLLIDNGADATLTENGGSTPMQYAWRYIDGYKKELAECQVSGAMKDFKDYIAKKIVNIKNFVVDLEEVLRDKASKIS